MYRMSIPASRSVVAKVWRNICGVAAYCSGSFRRYFRMIRRTDCGESALPRSLNRTVLDGLSTEEAVEKIMAVLIERHII